MKRFKIGDPVIWQDEQTNDITGIITEVNKRGFRIDWNCPSPYGDEKNEVFYRWTYLYLKTPSGESVIRLDIPTIRDRKINQVMF